MVNKFIAQCLEMFENEDVKNQCKTIIRPIIEILIYELMPYLYFITFFVIVCFIINLATLVILFKKKTNLTKLI